MLRFVAGKFEAKTPETTRFQRWNCQETAVFGRGCKSGFLQIIGKNRWVLLQLGLSNLGFNRGVAGHGAAEVLLDSSGSDQLTLTASMLFCVGQLTLKDGPNEEGSDSE